MILKILTKTRVLSLKYFLCNSFVFAKLSLRILQDGNLQGRKKSNFHNIFCDKVLWTWYLRIGGKKNCACLKEKETFVSLSMVKGNSYFLAFLSLRIFTKIILSKDLTVFLVFWRHYLPFQYMFFRSLRKLFYALNEGQNYDIAEIDDTISFGYLF